MDDKKIERLLAKFSPEEIEYLTKGGKRLAYISHQAVTRRLLEVFGMNWSFEIVETRIEADAVAVLGRLTCEGNARMQWGGKDRKGFDLDDALKSAGSYALKKCASLFGIGLYLWDDAPTEAETQRALREERAQQGTKPASSTQAKPAAQPTAARPTSSSSPRQAQDREDQRELAERRQSGGGQRSTPTSGAGVSEAQLNAISAIGKSLGWNSEAIRQHSIDELGFPPDKLSRGQASTLIDDLKSRQKKAAA
jgi:hypothetical protein